MYTSHIAAATIQEHQNSSLPTDSSACNSATVPMIAKGPAIKTPVNPPMMKTIQDFGLSLGKNGFLEVF